LRVGLLSAAEARAWDRFVAAHPAGHLLQSWEWGAFKAGQAWTPARLAVRRQDDGAILGAAQVLFRRPVKGAPVSIAYVPRGPVAPLGDADPVGVALEAGLHALCRRRGAIFLKIEPNLPAGDALSRALRGAGFVEAQRVQPRRSILLDLRPDAPEDTLLAAMKPKTRYNIRLALRRGVQVRQGTSAADLQQFYDLLQVTGERDEFGLHSFDYYRAAWAEFGPGAPASPARPVAALFLAEHPDVQGGPVAGLMAFAFGAEAIYMYGASADRGREHMPTYLLQWEAMRWARARGCRRYDFWGIPDAPEAEAPEAGENQNVRQGLWGVYRFKQGFGGQEIDYAGAWDYVYRPLAYTLYRRLLARRTES
jgi:lipid II:glycine glycyltransferase (peptidoglycan interpeptide bridge formation enzyme)